MSRAKRQDLQGIRGFAILAVLLFHFYPKQFPNGYIGVDQFFVLSGFLIAMVLSKEDAIDTDSIKSFYYRRVKRIIPLYLFVILFILLSLLFLFPDTIFEKNSDSAWAALLFATNLRGDDPEKQYLALLTLAEDAFAHTWSLAVEMQFYLLVPLFFYILRRLPPQYKSFFIATVVSLSGYYHATADEYTSFNSVFARLWQFFSGIFAFLTTENVNNLTKNKTVDIEQNGLVSEKVPLSDQKYTTMLSYVVGACCLTTILMCLFPIKITDLLLRVSITLQTVAMMMAGSCAQNMLVSNKAICYLGDISYAVYLVHWPIYSYCKQHSSEHNFIVLCSGFVCSIVLGVLLTETYEKYYLKLKRSRIYLLIAVLYILCLCLLLPDIIRDSIDSEFSMEFPTRENITKEEAIKLNREIEMKEIVTLNVKNCRSPISNKTVILKEFCEFDEVRNGTKKMMILGNSYAANIANTIYENCKTKASRLTMYAAKACEGLIETTDCPKSYDCIGQLEKMLKLAQEEKPDILFMMDRHMEFFAHRPKNNTKDVMVEKAVNTLKEYEKVVKEKIFVLNAMPRSKRAILSLLNKALRGGKLITQKDVDSGANWHLARDRLQKIVESCAKCEMIDFMPAFVQKGTFRFFDESNGVAYFSNVIHLTHHGKQFVDPVIKKVCRAL